MHIVFACLFLICMTNKLPHLILSIVSGRSHRCDSNHAETMLIMEHQKEQPAEAAVLPAGVPRRHEALRSAFAWSLRVRSKSSQLYSGSSEKAQWLRTHLLFLMTQVSFPTLKTYTSSPRESTAAF